MRLRYPIVRSLGVESWAGFIVDPLSKAFAQIHIETLDQKACALVWSFWKLFYQLLNS